MTTETAMEAPVVGSDGAADTSTPVEATTEQQDFAVDEASLPTEDPTPEYQWVLDKYKTDKGDYDGIKAAEALAHATKKLSDKGMMAPDTADGYEFDLGETSVFDDESLTEARAAFKEMDLPAKYAEPLLKLYEQRVNEVMEAVKEQQGESVAAQFTAENAEKTLRETWGKDFDNQLKHADRALKTFYKGDISQHAELANNPAFAQIMAEVGRQLSEDNAPSNTPPQPKISDAEMEELMARPDYWDKMNDRESDLYKKVQAYYAE